MKEPGELRVILLERATACPSRVLENAVTLDGDGITVKVVREKQGCQKSKGVRNL